MRSMAIIIVYGQTGTRKIYTMSGGNGKKDVIQKTFIWATERQTKRL